MTRESRTYVVEGMSCEHCRASVSEEITEIEGVDEVTVDLPSGRVEVSGIAIRDEEVEAAVEQAGYRLAESR